MAQKIYLYNSLVKHKEEFVPIDSNNVRMYVCGPTLYSDIHIGNARAIVLFDVLFRLLKHVYGSESVKYVRNITDIDDKIIFAAKSKLPGLDVNDAVVQLLQGLEKEYRETCTMLSCLPPSVEPKVSDNISEIHKIIEKLVSSKHAYIADDHVLFDVTSYSDYGLFSNRYTEELIAGARVAVASYKKNPGDFVLWKPAEADEPAWDSPCGILRKGRPGWHIECSAMALANLVEPYGGGIGIKSDLNIFDIHGGGVDLVFPHHENEIAQTCCALDSKKVANYWVHNATLLMEGKKMSKSDGNVVFINDIIAYNPDKKHFNIKVLRLVLLQTHYRKQLNWSEDIFNEASTEYTHWVSACLNIEPGGDISDFYEALYNDINVPEAIAVMRGYYKHKEYNKLAMAMEFLGLDYDKCSYLSDDINSLIAKRYKALFEGNWQLSDELRKQIEAKGAIVTDNKDEDGNRYMRVSFMR